MGVLRQAQHERKTPMTAPFVLRLSRNEGFSRRLPVEILRKAGVKAPDFMYLSEIEHGVL
jgi:hypothetical protein